MDSSLKAITINGSVHVESEEDAELRRRQRRRKRSRWDNDTGTKQDSIQDQIRRLQMIITETTTKLSRPDLGIPADKRKRSPSPEPLYNGAGVRINTRQDRVRQKLVSSRNDAITKLKALDPSYQPPSNFKFKNTKLEERVMIPAEDYPNINFMGLLLGPRGNFLEEMKKETKCSIIIRGRGSLKSGMTGIKKDGKKFDCLEEPLHAHITGSTIEDVKNAANKIKSLIDMQIYDPDCEKAVVLRSKHMHELAVLNGTIKDIDLKCLTCGKLGHKTWQCVEATNFTASVICSACGSVGHLTKDCCQMRPGSSWNKCSGNKAVIDQEYQSFLTDMGLKPSTESTSESKNYVPPMGDLSSVPLMLTNGSSAPGAASAHARNLPYQNGLKNLGTTIFGGKKHRLTAGYKSPHEIEMEEKRKKKEAEYQPVPLEWRVERYEQKINDKYEEYVASLKKVTPKTKVSLIDSTAEMEDLPNLIETPDVNLSKMTS